MKEIKDTCYRGTRILLGNRKREMLNKMIAILIGEDFQEISIPIIQMQDTFVGKVGEENNNLMFNFKDRGNRDVCLAPEYTAVIQKLSTTAFKYQKDIKLFYIQECFRGERPQAGRYRQFTQLGVEILNPSLDFLKPGYNLQVLAMRLITMSLGKQMWDDKKVKDITEFESWFQTNENVTRGLDYYKEGKGFEITCEKLGSSKQICGGGAYEGGVGFAIGIDRLLNI